MGEAQGGAAPDYTSLAARAAALVPVLRARAEQAEALRRVPDETLADLHTAGLFRTLQPKRVGGSELSYRAFVELGAIIARGCASTAWVLNNLASHHWMLAMWPKDAQDEIWGESADDLIGSSLIFPPGKARRVEGGYRLSGRWPFSSGVDPSHWNMLGGCVLDEGGRTVENRIFIVPARDYAVIDTWFVTGLRATGSKDVAMTDVFVPEHRTLPLAALKGGPTPGSAVNPAPLYKLPPMSLFAYVVASVSLGIAQGTIEQFVDATRSRVALYTGRNIADLATVQLRIGEASALADAAAALAFKDIDEAMRIAEMATAPTDEQKLRWRRNGAYAAGLCTRAVDLVFTATGGSGIFLSQPIQRSFRDIHAANAHYALSWDVNGTLYGRAALGLPPEMPIV